jgi:hypothetical protein
VGLAGQGLGRHRRSAGEEGGALTPAAGQYAVRRAVIGAHPFMPLTEAEFSKLERSHVLTSELIDFEEKFDVLSGNFLSLEKALLRITLEREIWHDLDYWEFQNIRTEINRKILNLLSTCRLYQDSKITHLKTIFGAGSSFPEEVAKKNSEIYDGSFSFRFMEALRNYAQHRAFAVSGVTLHGRWIDAYNSSLPHWRRQGISMQIDLSELDSNFKKSVLLEAKTLDPFPELKLMVREYVDGIRTLHAFTRKAVEELAKESDDALAVCLDQYKVLDKSDSDIGVAVIKMKDPPTFDVRFYLFSDRARYRKTLEKKNHTAGKFALSYISSEIVEK